MEGGVGSLVVKLDTWDSLVSLSLYLLAIGIASLHTLPNHVDHS